MTTSVDPVGDAYDRWVAAERARLARVANVNADTVGPVLAPTPARKARRRRLSGGSDLDLYPLSYPERRGMSVVPVRPDDWNGRTRSRRGRRRGSYPGVPLLAPDRYIGPEPQQCGLGPVRTADETVAIEHARLEHARKARKARKNAARAAARKVKAQAEG